MRLARQTSSYAGSDAQRSRGAQSHRLDGDPELVGRAARLISVYDALRVAFGFNASSSVFFGWAGSSPPARASLVSR
jgi:hypothetical protein